MISKMFISSYI